MSEYIFILTLKLTSILLLRVASHGDDKSRPMFICWQQLLSLSLKCAERKQATLRRKRAPLVKLAIGPIGSLSLLTFCTVYLCTKWGSKGGWVPLGNSSASTKQHNALVFRDLSEFHPNHSFVFLSFWLYICSWYSNYPCTTKSSVTGR